MSVQAGIWNFDGRPADPKLLAGFSESLKQQGPDGESSFIDGSITMLYRPFHTTAESRREEQPSRSRRGFILTWDGRLDNRDELIADLRSDLEREPTDLAVVAAAFDRWETHCFCRIVGDWAASIWKPQQRQLIFACDYMSIRHVFYYLKRDCIWWSTDLAPLVLLPGDKFHIDDNYIAGYFANQPDADLTPYREIREVPPGQFVCICNGRASVQRYWRFNPKSRIRYKTDAEYEAHFRYVFRQSVRRRLRSDSRILAELSGGLDSSSIVCMADDIHATEGALTPRVETLSYFDRTEPHGDDWIYVSKIEARRGRPGTHIDGSKTDGATSLTYPEYSALPGYLRIGVSAEAEREAVMREAGYRVVLSGMGGDEFMGGNPDPRALLGDLIVQFKPLALFRELIAWSAAKRMPWVKLLWRSAIDLLPPSLGQFVVKEAKVESWIKHDFARRTRMASRQIDVNEHFGLLLPTRRGYAGAVVRMADTMSKVTNQGHVLEETRYPYLDRSVIEFILSIPASQLLRPGERRSLMRRALIGIVPQEVLDRRTKQVAARTPVLALEKHWEDLRDVFQASYCSILGYVDPACLLKTVSDAQMGKVVPLVRVLWTVSLEFWLRDMAARALLQSSARPLALLRHQSVPADAGT